MSQAKRRREQLSRVSEAFGEMLYESISSYRLPPAPEIDGPYMAKLAGDESLGDFSQVMLQTYRAEISGRMFHFGIALGDGESFSAVGSAVIAQLGFETQNGQLHVVPVFHTDIAWEIVLCHLRSFDGQTLLFVSPDPDTYNARVAEMRYSKHICSFGPDGEERRRLTSAERRRIREQTAAIQDRPPPPKFYSLPGVEPDDALWIFGVVTPAGKMLRVAVWNGRRNYAHEFPKDLFSKVGGNHISLAQVDAPVGIKDRSSLDLTHKISLKTLTASSFGSAIPRPINRSSHPSFVLTFNRQTGGGSGRMGTGSCHLCCRRRRDRVARRRMVELKHSEIRLIENFVAWPRGFGYVLDFSDRAFAEFFEDEFRVDIDDQVYRKRGSSKRQRLISFCLDAPAPLVTQVLRMLFSNRRAYANEQGHTPEDGLEAEFEALIQAIETRGDEPRTDAIDRYAVDRTLDELVADLNRTLESNKPEVAMDHLHTYCMKKIAFLLGERGESCAEDEALHARFGRYRKILVFEQDLQPVTDLAMKSAISVFEKFNDVRNHHSLAHDSVILRHHEARYVFDAVTAVLRFLKALEAGRFETSK